MRNTFLTLLCLIMTALLLGQVTYNDKILAAAQSGNPEGQFQLGMCLQDGLGVDKDLAEAVKWYTQAAQQGHPGAQNNLAYCYYNGLGTEIDKQQAADWFRRAANQNVVSAQSAWESAISTAKALAKISAKP